MKLTARIKLEMAPDAHQALYALQGAYAAGCHSLVAMVRRERCWNRVALHNLGYTGLREHGLPTILTSWPVRGRDPDRVCARCDAVLFAA